MQNLIRHALCLKTKYEINKFTAALLLGIASISIFSSCSSDEKKAGSKTAVKDSTGVEEKEENLRAPVDTAKYDALMKKLANGDTTGKWPVKKHPYPLDGAILPFKRIVVYYGNLHSKKWVPWASMLQRNVATLTKEVKHWEKVDPSTPVQVGLHYIAAVASGTEGKDGKYINRMGNKQIDSVLKIAKMHPNTIVFLDLQVALSTIKAELPHIEKYLQMPQVHLGIDPEFSMKDGSKPG